MTAISVARDVETATAHSLSAATPASASRGRLPCLPCRNSVRWMWLTTVTSDSSTRPISQPVTVHNVRGTQRWVTG